MSDKSVYSNQYLEHTYNAIKTTVEDSGEDILSSMTQFSDTIYNQETKSTKASALLDSAYRNKERLGISETELDKDPQKAISNVIAYKIAEYGQKTYDNMYEQLLSSGRSKIDAHNGALQLANETVLKLYDPLTQYGGGLESTDPETQKRFNAVINKFAVIDPDDGKVYVDAKDIMPDLDYITDKADPDIKVKAIKEDRFISSLDTDTSYKGIGPWLGATLTQRSLIGGVLSSMAFDNLADYGAADEYWMKQSGMWNSLSTLGQVGVTLGETVAIAALTEGIGTGLSATAQGFVRIGIQAGTMTAREAVYDISSQSYGLTRQYIGDNIRQENNQGEFWASRGFDFATYLGSSYLTGRFVAPKVNAFIANSARGGSAFQTALMASKDFIVSATDASIDYAIDAASHNLISAIADEDDEYFTESQVTSLGLDKDDRIGSMQKIFRGMAMRIGMRAYGNFLKIDTYKKTASQDVRDPLFGSKEYYANANKTTKALAWISRRFGGTDEQIDAYIRTESGGDPTKVSTTLKEYFASPVFNAKAYARMSMAVEATRNSLLRYKLTPDGIGSGKLSFIDMPIARQADNIMDTRKFASVEKILPEDALIKEDLRGSDDAKVSFANANYVFDKVNSKSTVEEKQAEINRQLKNITQRYNFDSYNSKIFMDALNSRLNQSGDANNIQASKHLQSLPSTYSSEPAKSSLWETSGDDFIDYLRDTSADEFKSNHFLTTKKGSLYTFGNTASAYEDFVSSFKDSYGDVTYAKNIFDEMFPDNDSVIERSIENFKNELNSQYSSWESASRSGTPVDAFTKVQKINELKGSVANELIKRHFRSIEEITARHTDELKNPQINALVFQHMSQIQLLQNTFGIKVKPAMDYVSSRLNTNESILIDRLKAAKLPEDYYSEAVRNKIKEANTDSPTALDVLAMVTAGAIQDNARYGINQFLVNHTNGKDRYSLSDILNLYGYSINDPQNYKSFISAMPGYSVIDGVDININGKSISVPEIYAAIQFGRGVIDADIDKITGSDSDSAIMKTWIGLMAFKDDSQKGASGILSDYYDRTSSNVSIDPATGRLRVDIVLKNLDKIPDNWALEIAPKTQKVLVTTKDHGYDTKKIDDFIEYESNLKPGMKSNRHYNNVLNDFRTANTLTLPIDKAIQIAYASSTDDNDARSKISTVLKSASMDSWNTYTPSGQEKLIDKIIQKEQSRKYIDISIKDGNLKDAIYSATNVISSMYKFKNGEVMLFAFDKDEAPDNLPTSRKEQIKNGYVELTPAGNNLKKTFMIVRGHTDNQKYKFILDTFKSLVEDNIDHVIMTTPSGMSKEDLAIEKKAILEILNDPDFEIGTAKPGEKINLEEKISRLLTGILDVKKKSYDNFLDQYKNTKRDLYTNKQSVLNEEITIPEVTGSKLITAYNALESAAYPVFSLIADRSVLDLKDVGEYSRLAEEYSTALESKVGPGKPYATVADKDADVELKRIAISDMLEKTLGLSRGAVLEIDDDVDDFIKLLSFDKNYFIQDDTAVNSRIVKATTELFTQVLSEAANLRVLRSSSATGKYTARTINDLMEEAKDLKSNIGSIRKLLRNQITSINTMAKKLSEEYSKASTAAVYGREKDLTELGIGQPRRDPMELLRGGNTTESLNSNNPYDSNLIKIRLEDNSMWQRQYASVSDAASSIVKNKNLIKQNKDNLGGLLSLSYSMIVYGDKIFTEYDKLGKRVSMFGVSDMYSLDYAKDASGSDIEPRIIFLADEQLNGVGLGDGTGYITSKVFESLYPISDYGTATKMSWNSGNTAGKMMFDKLSPETHMDIYSHLNLDPGRDYIIIPESLTKNWDPDMLRQISNNGESLRSVYMMGSKAIYHDMIMLDSKIRPEISDYVKRFTSQFKIQSNPKMAEKKYNLPFQAAQTDIGINYLLNTIINKDIEKFRNDIQTLGTKFYDDFEELADEMFSKQKIMVKKNGVYAQYGVRKGMQALDPKYHILSQDHNISTVHGIEIQGQRTPYLGSIEIGGLIIREILSEGIYKASRHSDSYGNNILEAYQRIEPILTNGNLSDNPAKIKAYKDDVKIIMDFLSDEKHGVFKKFKIKGEDAYVVMDNRSPNTVAGSTAFKIIKGIVPGSDKIHTDLFYNLAQGGDWDGDQGLLTLITAENSALNNMFKFDKQYENVAFLDSHGNWIEDKDGTSIILKAMNERNIKTMENIRDVSHVRFEGTSISKFDEKLIDDNLEMSVGLTIKALENASSWTNMASKNTEAINGIIRNVFGEELKKIDSDMYERTSGAFEGSVSSMVTDVKDRFVIYTTGRNKNSADDPGEEVYGGIESIKLGRKVYKRGTSTFIPALMYHTSSPTDTGRMYHYSVAILEADGGDFGYRVKAMVPVDSQSKFDSNTSQEYISRIASRIKNELISTSGEMLFKDLHKNLASDFVRRQEDVESYSKYSSSVDDKNFRINSMAATYWYFQQAAVEIVKNHATTLFVHKYGKNSSNLIKRTLMKSFVGQFFPVKPIIGNEDNLFLGTSLRIKGGDSDMVQYLHSKGMNAHSYNSVLIDKVTNTIMSGDYRSDVITYKDYEEFMDIVKSKKKVTNEQRHKAYEIYQRNQGMTNVLYDDADHAVKSKVLYSYPAEFLYNMMRFKVLDTQRERLFTKEALISRDGITEEAQKGFFDLNDDGSPNMYMMKSSEKYSDILLLPRANKLSKLMHTLSSTFGGTMNLNQIAGLQYGVRLAMSTQSVGVESKAQYLEKLGNVIGHLYGKNEGFYSAKSIEDQLSSVGIYLREKKTGRFELQSDVSKKFIDMNFHKTHGPDAFKKFTKSVADMADEKARNNPNIKVIEFVDESGKTLSNKDLYIKFNNAFTDASKAMSSAKAYGTDFSFETRDNPGSIKALFDGVSMLVSKSDQLTIGIYSKGITEDIVSKLISGADDMGKFLIDREITEEFIDKSMGFKLEVPNVDSYIRTASNQSIRCR